MIESVVIALIVCGAGLLAQRQHYSATRRSVNDLQIQELAKAFVEDVNRIDKEIKELKSNMSALNMKVGFNK